MRPGDSTRACTGHSSRRRQRYGLFLGEGSISCANAGACAITTCNAGDETAWLIVRTVDQQSGIAAAWDAEYRAGRYRDEPPVAFVQDILAAARAAGLTDGLYIGCGNGRNYLPLVAAGLDLTGLDISAAAIAQLAARAPEHRQRLIQGDLTALPTGATYPLVIGIQVFQHGDRARAHAHVRAARARVAPGGLFCLRVNAAETDVWPEHEVTEHEPDGSRTVRYLAGPKQGLYIHFFTATELGRLFGGGFEPVLAPRLQRTRRVPAGRGQWSQWEAIYRSRDR
jgi:SAM-dependent methyltransferase